MRTFTVSVFSMTEPESLFRDNLESAQEALNTESLLLFFTYGGRSEGVFLLT